MNEHDFLALLGKYDFVKIGRFLIANDQISFELSNQANECGFVYLWVECAEQKYTVVYVGMAGKTLKARCDQHRNGFVVSSTGKAHSVRLLNGVKDGKRYDVYARKAALADVVGESAIPLVCAEELVFIKKFRPPWNAPSARAEERNNGRS